MKKSITERRQGGLRRLQDGGWHRTVPPRGQRSWYWQQGLCAPLLTVLLRSLDNHLELAAPPWGRFSVSNQAVSPSTLPLQAHPFVALFLRWQRTNDDDHCLLLNTLNEKAQ